MNNISQNIRYYPHDLNTKFYATKLYKSGYPISTVCKKYKNSKSYLKRPNNIQMQVLNRNAPIKKKI